MLSLYLAVLLLLIGFLFVVFALSVKKKKVIYEDDFSEEINFSIPETQTNQEISSVKVEPSGLSGEGMTFNGALYEDRDNAIKPGVESTVDYSTIGKYKSLKRIAAGSVSVTGSSIDFREGSKLYRYNFHRINRIVPMNESALVYPESSSYPLLYISDSPEFSRLLVSSFSKK